MSKKREQSGAKDKVGYGRPPRHTQFKPGQSGNPSGKRNRTRSASSILQDQLQSEITVIVGGKTKKIAWLEAIIKQLAKDAVAGNDKARKLILSLAFANEERGIGLAEDEFSPELNHELFQGFLKRLGVEIGQESRSKKLNRKE